MLEIVEGEAIGGSGWAPAVGGASAPHRARGPGQRGLARRQSAAGAAEE